MNFLLQKAGEWLWYTLKNQVESEGQISTCVLRPLKYTTFQNNSCTLWPIKHWNYRRLNFPLRVPWSLHCFLSFSSSFYFLVLFLLLHPPSLSLPSPSLSKWVSSGVLAGRNHLRANTLLSVVKASPQIPFYTHKCHFPFVCTLAALAEPSRPRASSQTRPAEENQQRGKALVLHSCPINTTGTTRADLLPFWGIKNIIISANLSEDSLWNAKSTVSQSFVLRSVQEIITCMTGN